jgi:predicted ArsR family transcriptional regulator
MKHESGSRLQILSLLREDDQTVQDLAERLGLTRNAIRAQLESLQEEGLVRRGGQRAGVRKPHAIYTLTEKAAQVLPNAYGVLLRQLVGILRHRLSPRDVNNCLRELGKQLSKEPAEQTSDGTPQERRRAALNLFKSLGGEASLSTKDGIEMIDGKSCPLGIVTSLYPGACLIAQTALAEIIGEPVRELCTRGARPRCRFQISV